MSRIKFGVKLDALKESEDLIDLETGECSLNYVFTRLINDNPDAKTLQVYSLDAQFYQPSEPPSLYDGVHRFWDAAYIDAKFIPFISGFRSKFVFSGSDLGYVKNLTEAQLDELVPDNWPFAMGRTFREYTTIPETIGEDKYYHMYGYHILGNGMYTSRLNETNEVDFWLFYDRFAEIDPVSKKATNIFLRYQYLDELKKSQL